MAFARVGWGAELAAVGHFRTFEEFLHTSHWIGKSESNGEAVPPEATFNTWV